ncbi:MAG TPA: hypothetical protein VFR99_09485 [Marmoricola sp.]|nr:hypothetical protein [Marmoricola sp.]
MNKRVKMVLLSAAAIPLVAGMVGAIVDEARGAQGVRDEGASRVVAATTSRPPSQRPRPAKPAPATATPTAHSSQEDGETALTQLALEVTWKKLTPDERHQECVAWRTDRYTALEAFMEGADAARTGYRLDGGTVMRFFDQRCGS